MGQALQFFSKPWDGGMMGRLASGAKVLESPFGLSSSWPSIRSKAQNRPGINKKGHPEGWGKTRERISRQD
jgi:hypothetical protein